MSYPQTVEYRPRSKDAPDVRVFIGRPTSKRDAKRMVALRDLLQRLGRRGDWDVIQAASERHITPEAVAALVDQYGVSDYRTHLEVTPRSGPTVAEHVERWLSQIGNVNTRENYTSGVKPLVDTVGDMPWHRVDASHIADARKALEDAGLSAATQRVRVMAWSSFFNWALQREEDAAEREGRKPHAVVNPVRKSAARKPVPTAATRKRFLSREEFRALVDAAPADMKAQYATLVLAALRLGELIHLPPAHVRLDEHPHIRVDVWGEWAPKGYPRYQHGVRTVPVERSTLLPLLREYRELYAGTQRFFVNPRSGEPWSANAFRARFYRDVEAAGMTPGKFRDGERIPHGVTPHTCRHTLPSWLAERDVQLMKIAAIAGDTVKTVQTHYAHLLPSSLDAAVQGVLE